MLYGLFYGDAITHPLPPLERLCKKSPRNKFFEILLSARKKLSSSIQKHEL